MQFSQLLIICKQFQVITHVSLFTSITTPTERDGWGETPLDMVEPKDCYFIQSN